MKGRLVGKFGAEDRVARPTATSKSWKASTMAGGASPAKVISYVLGVTSGLVQSANECVCPSQA